MVRRSTFITGAELAEYDILESIKQKEFKSYWTEFEEAERDLIRWHVIRRTLACNTICDLFTNITGTVVPDNLLIAIKIGIKREFLAGLYMGERRWNISQESMFRNRS